MSDAFQLRLATSADVDLISWHHARMFQDMGELPPEYFSAAADTAASWDQRILHRSSFNQ
jgi:hypothetical protein